MLDNRVQKRTRLIYYLKVLERETNDPVGYLVDLTPQGMMLMSEAPITAGQVFQLKVVLDGDAADAACLQVDATSRWCRKSVNSDFYDAGFELVNLDVPKLVFIEKILEDLGFNE